MIPFSPKPVSAFTIDVEDGINILMRDLCNIDIPPTDRVVNNVDKILGLCDEYNVKATFFILGEVAENFPDLIKRIDKPGHEIGIHGYRHDQIFRLTPDRFRHDLTKAKNLMEEITGKRIMGFRAPAFSINSKTAWALEVIAECGFTYDSSIVPAKMGRYGWEGFESTIIKLELPNNQKLIEAPLPVVKFLGKSIPACGGGYLRYFPLQFTRYAFTRVLKHQPVIVYMHPYEIDTGKYPTFFLEASKKLSIRKRLPFLTYRLMKGTVYKKLSSLLRNYSFTPLKDIIETMDREQKLITRKYNDFISS